jgi:SAM-dependent methyltransferase
MDEPREEPRTLHTPGGDLPLHEYHLRAGGRAWAILHTGAILSRDDESQIIGESRERLPYGVALWPAAIALAHEVLARAEAMRGARILELGAGTGLPGIVAASLGGRVVQTDRNELVLSICRRNGARNAAPPIAYRLADWAGWDDDERYDWIIGADILYGAAMHAELRRIFERNLGPGGASSSPIPSAPRVSPSWRRWKRMVGRSPSPDGRSARTPRCAPSGCSR